MLSNPTTSSILPPDLFDTTTLLSLLSTILLVLFAYTLSLYALPSSPNRPVSFSSAVTPTILRFLFIWHASDALCHFVLEGSFLYHCFFSSAPVADLLAANQAAAAVSTGAGLLPPLPIWPTPLNWLGRGIDHSAEVAYGAQAGGANVFAQLWMVYARADVRWAGVDLGVVSLELLTVLFDGPLATYICYCISKRDPKAYIWMIILATAELYGGFMTFCPEWLSGNINLDTSNWMYLWLYLAFFNLLWVFIPLYIIWLSVKELSGALMLAQRNTKSKTG